MSAKTTVNLAWACPARFDGSAIDVDAQGHVGSALREQFRADLTSLSEVLLSEKTRDLMDFVIETDIEHLSITAPDKRLSETDHLLATRVGREYVLKGALANARSLFDVILIDCPPNLGNLTLNALVAADYALIPCDMSLLAFEGLTNVHCVGTASRATTDILGIVRIALGELPDECSDRRRQGQLWTLSTRDHYSHVKAHAAPGGRYLGI